MLTAMILECHAADEQARIEDASLAVVCPTPKSIVLAIDKLSGDAVQQAQNRTPSGLYVIFSAVVRQNH